MMAAKELHSAQLGPACSKLKLQTKIWLGPFQPDEKLQHICINRYQLVVNLVGICEKEI